MSPQQLVDVLNEACAADSEAMHTLAETRVPCKAGIVDHPTIQVAEGDGGHVVGLIGLLNGAARRFDGSTIAGMYDDATGKLQRFKVLEQRWQPPPEAK